MWVLGNNGKNGNGLGFEETIIIVFFIIILETHSFSKDKAIDFSVVTKNPHASANLNSTVFMDKCRFWSNQMNDCTISAFVGEHLSRKQE